MIGVHEYAKKIGVTDSTIRRWCQEKYLKGVERDGIGRPWRIPENTEPPAFRNKKRIKLQDGSQT